MCFFVCCLLGLETNSETSGVSCFLFWFWGISYRFQNDWNKWIDILDEMKKRWDAHEKAADKLTLDCKWVRYKTMKTFILIRCKYLSGGTALIHMYIYINIHIYLMIYYMYIYIYTYPIGWPYWVSISITTPLHTPPYAFSCQPLARFNASKNQLRMAVLEPSGRIGAWGWIVIFDSLDSPQYVTLDEWTYDSTILKFKIRDVLVIMNEADN